MKKCNELIVMLTQNDYTVSNAMEIFEKNKDSHALYWGMKEKGLPIPEMQKLYAYMKECGKKTVLEVVAYTQEEAIEGANLAISLHCDILLGSFFCEEVFTICKENQILYMPFAGQIQGRPSILSGSIEEIIRESCDVIQKGADGIDILGYRYVGDAAELNQQLVAAVPAPVCIAGSIDSYQRLDDVKAASPRFFTIGSAFFDHRFGEDFTEQINLVCEYMERIDAK